MAAVADQKDKHRAAAAQSDRWVDYYGGTADTFCDRREEVVILLVTSVKATMNSAVMAATLQHLCTVARRHCNFNS